MLISMQHAVMISISAPREIYVVNTTSCVNVCQILGKYSDLKKRKKRKKKEKRRKKEKKRKKKEKKKRKSKKERKKIKM
jgi:choline-glycine betaine transporter